MKAITSIRINQDVLNHLRTLKVNLSKYINKLILRDLTKEEFEDTNLKKIVESAERDEKKSLVLEEMRIIGAIANIPTRLEEMSKNDDIVYHCLIKQNINLLELEYENDYSKETKFLIKNMYKKIIQINKDQFEPYQKEKKLLKNGKKKNKKKNKKK